MLSMRLLLDADMLEQGLHADAQGLVVKRPGVRWRLRCFGFRNDYSMSLAY
jgi:hypothetical protein